MARGANLALAVHLDRLIKREGRREWDARDDFKAFVAPFVGESVARDERRRPAPALQLQSAANEDRE